MQFHQTMNKTAARSGAPLRRVSRGRATWVRALGALAMIGALFAATPAEAFRFTPIVQDFKPSGREAVKNFTVTNTTPGRLAVEIRMARRSIAPDGTETLTPEDKDFIVFPSQVALEPGKTQTVQVRWVGAPDPKAELSYRIIAEQLPVELDKTRQDVASIRLLIKYEGSVYVVPKGVKSEIQLEGLRRVTGKDGKAQLEVSLANRGSAHGIVRAPKLALTDSQGGHLTLSGEAVKGLDNVNILAGGMRHVLLPWPAKLKPGNVTGKLDSKIER